MMMMVMMMMIMMVMWMISYSILGNTWYTYVCMWTKISFLIHTFCLASLDFMLCIASTFCSHLLLGKP